METYWIVKGMVTDIDGMPEGVEIGDTEWQFSDAPRNKRGSSYDYLELETGLRDLSPAIFIWEG